MIVDMVSVKRCISGEECAVNVSAQLSLCLWDRYGIQEFVVISPGTTCEAIISESKCNLLLSSISMSLANSGW